MYCRCNRVLKQGKKVEIKWGQKISIRGGACQSYKRNLPNSSSKQNNHTAKNLSWVNSSHKTNMLLRLGCGCNKNVFFRDYFGIGATILTPPEVKWYLVCSIFQTSCYHLTDNMCPSYRHDHYLIWPLSKTRFCQH